MQADYLNNQNKRIVSNTLMLYTRQILVLLVSLYTVRVTLDVLGVEDFGIYNVVGGIVLLMSFLSGTMASATQRFFSFALGENNKEKLKKTFSVNLILYLILSLTALILLETIGLCYVKKVLKLPMARYDAALYVYHLSSLSFFFTMLSAPFMAIIIAYEDMKIYAYVSVVEILLKLFVAFLIIFIESDKLELYGLLLFFVSLLNFFIYAFICTKKYSECQFSKYYWDNNLFKLIISFTGWTLFGQLSTVIRSHAVTIILNQSFGPMVVAARVISSNISGRINMFASNFNLGIYPSIIKNYSSGNKDRMFELIYNGSKLTFSLMWIFALPFLIETEAILSLWLKEVPEHAVLFTRLALIESIITSISMPLTTAARAPGKMKEYELYLGGLNLLNFIMCWLFVSMGYPAYIVFIIAIIVTLLMTMVRLYLVSNLIGICVRDYINYVLKPILAIVITSATVSLSIDFFTPNSLKYSILALIIYFLTCLILIYFIALSCNERLKLNRIIRDKFLEFKNISKKQNLW